MLTPTEFTERAQRARALILDVDGVLSDGAIVYDDAGRESKRFHVRDGFGIRCWQRAGHQAAILTGRYTRVTDIRACELRVPPELVIQKAPQKGPAYRRLLERLGVAAEEVCYVGDDVPDLPPILASGIGVAVRDAVAEVRQSADWVTQAAGGQGAVREIVEALLTAQGRWSEVVAHYRRSALEEEGTPGAPA